MKSGYKQNPSFFFFFLIYLILFYFLYPMKNMKEETSMEC